MTKELIELYDAVRALEQAADGCVGFKRLATTIGKGGEDAVMRAWSAVMMAADAAQPKIDAMQAGFEACLTPAGPVQADDDDDVPAVWPEGTVEMVMGLSSNYSYCRICGCDYRKITCTELAANCAGDQGCPACRQLIEEIASGT